MQINLNIIAEITGGKLVNLSPNQDFAVSNILTDSRVDLSGALFVALKGENFDAHDFLDSAIKANAKAICVNKSCDESKLQAINVPILLVDDTLVAYQKIANYHRKSFSNLKVVAITGSVGKTSTKEMLKAIGIQCFGEEHTLFTIGNTNNQVGVPQNLLRLTNEHKLAVIEMGTNHFGEILPLSQCAEPEIAIINSIAPCHLENLIDLHGVAREKSDIFKGVKTGGYALISSDAPCLDELINSAKACGLTVLLYGSYKACNKFSSRYIGGDLSSSSFELINHSKGESTIVKWAITGKHQSLNAAGAAIVGELLGLSISEISQGLSHTVLPGMRMKKTTFEDVTYLNDAYNANPASMRATLNALTDFAEPTKTILVLGDMLELGSHEIGEHLEILEFALSIFPQSRIIAVGSRMIQASKLLEKSHASNKLFLAKDSESAYPVLDKLLRQGDLVFLKGSRGISLENAIKLEAR